MRKIEDVLRLHHACGRSNREIARAVRVSPSTVADYLRRARLAGLTWPLADGLTERAVEAALFPVQPASGVTRPEPDWAAVHRQLGRAGVTLDLLWQEYREVRADGYQYSAFCEHYRAFAHALPVTLRQRHAPGERLFVDYSGQTVPVIDPATGEERQAQVFVAVLGASSYTYVEATRTQGLGDWIGSHVRCLEYLGGVPELLVPDNLKRKIRGQAQLNSSCAYQIKLSLAPYPLPYPLIPLIPNRGATTFIRYYRIRKKNVVCPLLRGPLLRAYYVSSPITCPLLRYYGLPYYGPLLRPDLDVGRGCVECQAERSDHFQDDRKFWIRYRRESLQ
jgi:transposase